jgi:hypothetical protein
MANEEILSALRAYLEALKAQQTAIEPFFAKDSPLVLTPDRAQAIQASFDRVEQTKWAYQEAQRQAGWTVG